MLTSGSLIESQQAYLLPLELARGTIVQVRNQLAEWEEIGLAVPAAVPAKLAEAVTRFSWAAVTQEELSTSSQHAEAALCAALNAGDLLAAAYTEQALIVRRRNGGKLDCARWRRSGHQLARQLYRPAVPGHLQCGPSAAGLRDTETTEGNYSWTTSDKQVEWCRTHGLKVFAGPLLTLDPHALPDWYYLFEDDFESVLEFVSAFVRAAVERYRGKVDYWICAGRVNTAGVPSLSESERLQLVARTVDLVRSLDPDTPALVSFNQPWAEYLRQQESRLPPAAICRCPDAGGLGSNRRDDGNERRLLARRNVAAASCGVQSSAGCLEPVGIAAVAVALRTQCLSRGPVGPEQDAAATGQLDHCHPTDVGLAIRPVALAKPLVQGVLWNQLCDSQPHDFPHGGLFDERRQAKLALRTLATIRQTYMK